MSVYELSDSVARREWLQRVRAAIAAIPDVAKQQRLYGLLERIVYFTRALDDVTSKLNDLHKELSYSFNDGLKPTAASESPKITEPLPAISPLELYHREQAEAVCKQMFWNAVVPGDSLESVNATFVPATGDDPVVGMLLPEIQLPEIQQPVSVAAAVPAKAAEELATAGGVFPKAFARPYWAKGDVQQFVHDLMELADEARKLQPAIAESTYRRAATFLDDKCAAHHSLEVVGVLMNPGSVELNVRLRPDDPHFRTYVFLDSGSDYEEYVSQTFVAARPDRRVRPLNASS